MFFLRYPSHPGYKASVKKKKVLSLPLTCPQYETVYLITTHSIFILDVDVLHSYLTGENNE